ncbi:MAG TPA: zinc metalloprotease HtpX [Nitrospiraceae bacterium]|jgi:heat shock protein HtpX|nr:zinc metalloprotease HtpX [Nitrospiraceae bacterium]
MNNIKTLVLLVLLTLILVWAGAAFGGKQGMTIALFMAFAMNIFAYWFSDKMVLRMYRAKEVTEAEAPELFGIVRRLSQKAQIPMPKVYIMEEDQPNAFATGRNPKHAAVAVTTGILRLLSSDELGGVIGHELSHITHRDILISTITATIAGAISYLAQMAQWAAIFGRRGDDDEGGSPIAALVMMIVGPIAALVVQMAISRSREYLADEGGARLSGNPRYLSNALRKLNVASQKIPMDASPATSHMFIVNPLSGGGLFKLFSTHPPIEERIARLEAMSF